jgi:ribosomal protein S18 acetylase RimI-like enzyme
LSGPAIGPAHAEEIPAIARIHYASLPDDFLPSLGEDFLRTVYYPAALASANAVTLVARAGGETVGFVTVAHRTGAFTRDVLRGRALTLARYAVRAAWRRPAHLRQSAGVLWSALLGRPDPVQGEIVFIAVDAARRGAGLGPRIVDAALGHLRAHGISHCRTKTLAANLGVIRMYERLGWTVRDRFRLIGRSYVTLLSPRLTNRVGTVPMRSEHVP